MVTVLNQPNQFVRWFSELTLSDLPLVGGKNASLGESTAALASRGVRLPDGFAITAEGYWHFLDANGLRAPIEARLQVLSRQPSGLIKAARAIRRIIETAPFPADLADNIRVGYRDLATRLGCADPPVAVRSSATAEDLPGASFAGQQESYLNIVGEEAVLAAVRRCFSSLFTERAMSYCEAHGFGNLDVAMSVGVQQLVAWPSSSAGVVFSIDTETGFPNVAIVTAAWGLGEAVVKGEVSADEYVVVQAFSGTCATADPPENLRHKADSPGRRCPG
ncbi:MAG TPA: PEP/pyruvate-binding domain-containing protein [Tepidiformaceae bacterium]